MAKPIEETKPLNNLEWKNFEEYNEKIRSGAIKEDKVIVERRQASYEIFKSISQNFNNSERVG